MIPVQKLYEATDSGLDILALHYPDVREAAVKNMPFKARPGERTPSARVKLYNRNQYRVWILADFGDDGKGVDPLTVHMRETGLRFGEAILDLAQKFGVTDSLDKSVNKPDIRKTPAGDRKDGDCFWEFKEAFTDEELKVMGPSVTQGDCDALNWHSCQYVATVKNGEITYRYSTGNFPIFMRECRFTDKGDNEDVFYKVYEPLNPDKQWRFSYRPAGKKPREYTNGLHELIAAYKALNDEEEKRFRTDPGNENAKYRPKKIPEAIICSGERDSLCVKSMGYYPLWFNSETYNLSVDEYTELMKYVDVLYNIPDLDQTGRRRGAELALKFIDIRTIWLPEWLTTYLDNRGKPRKDFRDWNELRPYRSDFKELLATATPAIFWTKTWEKKKGDVYNINAEALAEFLRLSGFHLLADERGEPTDEIIRIDANVVKTVSMRSAREFVKRWALETGRPDRLRRAIMTTELLGSKGSDLLSPVRLDFSDSTSTSQTFYFDGCSVEVTADGIEKLDIRKVLNGRYVREKSLIRHKFSPLPDMFDITSTDPRNPDSYDIEIKAMPSYYFRYLVNASRIYWRKELEESMDALPPEEAAKYREAHHFDIAGPMLTEDEIRIQKKSLINKIFAIGYLLHRFKSLTRPWAPFLMDNTISDQGVANGGSGKSFLINAISRILPKVEMDGRNYKVLDGDFAFSMINDETRLVFVDDIIPRFPVDRLYNLITGSLNVNRKQENAYEMDFSSSPKFVLATNYALPDFSGSTRRRILFVSNSDYYHAQSEGNDYRESRNIADDLGYPGQLLTNDYPENLWNADLNFWMQCLRFYLSVAPLNMKLEPDMENIMVRSKKQMMLAGFEEWANVYFSRESNNLDTELRKDQVMSDYETQASAKKVSPHAFTKSLKAFCSICPWIAEFNPPSISHTDGRITRRVADRFNPNRTVIVEHYYIKSVPDLCKAETEDMADKQAAQPSSKLFSDDDRPEDDLPF